MPSLIIFVFPASDGRPHRIGGRDNCGVTVDNGTKFIGECKSVVAFIAVEFEYEIGASGE